MGQPELAEDAFYVLLHRSAGDEERLRYGLVGAALGHEGEDLALARGGEDLALARGGEGCEAFVVPPAGQELAHHLGIEEDIRYVHAVREAVGPDVRVMMDADCAYDVPAARRVLLGCRDAGVHLFEEAAGAGGFGRV